MLPNGEVRLFDPICGMWLAPDQAAVTFTYIGRTYSFCSAECRDLFARKPDVYVVRLAYDAEAYVADDCPVRRASGCGQPEPPVR